MSVMFKKFVRSLIKEHLTVSGKKGPRCPGLKKVIPVDVWVNDILPHYVSDATLPDLSSYASKSPGRPKKQFKDIKHISGLSLLQLRPWVI